MAFKTIDRRSASSGEGMKKRADELRFQQAVWRIKGLESCAEAFNGLEGRLQNLSPENKK